jgi:nucleoid DNA-binding protein
VVFTGLTSNTPILYICRMTTTADTAELLRRYFLQQQVVHLPGIGGFEMNRVPAQVDAQAGTIRAPYYTIRYDSLHDIPARDMFAYIAAKKEITEWEAIGVVNHFSQEMKELLRKGQKYEWEGMGSLENNESGQLIFEADPVQYPFQQDFNGVYEWKKYRETETSAGYTMPGADTEEPLMEEVEERASWWIWAAVLTAVALLLIFFNLVRNDYAFSSARGTVVTPSLQPSQYINKPAE